MSRLAQLPLPLLLPLLLLLLLLREVRCVAPTVVVGSSRRKPKNTKTDRLLHVHSCSMSPRQNTGDQLAGSTCTPWSRELATGDGATHARGSRCYQLLPWYHPDMLLLLLSCLLCWVVRETEWSADPISIFGSQHCVLRGACFHEVIFFAGCG